MNNNKGYEMKKLLQLGLILAASVALSFTMVSGEETMKCESGKCNVGKCGTDKNETKKVPAKPASEKGKCGPGKCS